MRDRFYSYVYVLPAFLLLLVFLYLTALFGIAGSFFSWTINSMRWNGLDNYAVILLNRFVSVAVRNSVVFTIASSAGKTVLGLLLAIFLNRRVATTNFLRSVFFFPAILSVVAVGAVFSMYLHPTLGIVNKTLTAIGLGKLAFWWLIDKHTAMLSVCLVEIWKWTGFVAVIFLGALQAVPRDLHEAAAIDGAGAARRHLAITIPFIMPTIKQVIIYQLIMGMRVFDLIIVTTNGGPGVSTKVLSQVVFENVTKSDYGTASAANNILSLIILVITLVGSGLLRPERSSE